MCSIFGYCGRVADAAAFEKSFARTKSRGPDDTRVVKTDNGILGFHRLSIMGLHDAGMQPFELGGCFAVCNGELYGFEKEREKLIRKGYSFRSGSDWLVIVATISSKLCDFPCNETSKSTTIYRKRVVIIETLVWMQNY